MNTPLNYGIASLIAVFIALVEVQGSLTKPLSWRGAALGWLAWRLLLDVSTSVVCLVWVLPIIDRGQPWFSGIGPALIAGFGGPVLFRAQLSTIKNGKEVGAFGPGGVYLRLRSSIDASLDDCSAVAQSNWLTNVVMPAVHGRDLLDVAEKFRMYIKTVDRMPEGEKRKHLVYIDQVLRDSNSSDYEKKRAIVQNALDSGGRRLIKTFVSDRGPQIPVSRTPDQD